MFYDFFLLTVCDIINIDYIAIFYMHLYASFAQSVLKVY